MGSKRSQPEVGFRPIQQGDKPFLSQLYASTRQDEMAAVPWSEEEKQRFLDFQFEAQSKFYQEQFPEGDFQIILLDGKPAGRLYIDRRPDEIRLVDIGLLPRHRRKGLGGRLMKGVLDEGRQAGKPVRIHVEHNNPAMRLYQRLGFRQIDTNGVYHLMEWVAAADGSEGQPS